MEYCCFAKILFITWWDIFLIKFKRTSTHTVVRKTYRPSGAMPLILSTNKVPEPSTRAGFKQKLDHKARNQQSLNHQDWKRHMHREHHSFRGTSNQRNINNTENVSRFDYSLLKSNIYLRNKVKALKGGFISSKVQKWENIIFSNFEILKTAKGLKRSKWLVVASQ